jgi:hypothetical protein
VKPQLLPLLLGVAFTTYWLGQLALTFQVEATTDGAAMFTVTVQVLEPETATARCGVRHNWERNSLAPRLAPCQASESP